MDGWLNADILHRINPMELLILFPINVYACLAGTRAETSTRVTGKEGFEADGIQGLKALGVRELSYRLAFLANHVGATNPRVRTSS